VQKKSSDNPSKRVRKPISEFSKKKKQDDFSANTESSGGAIKKTYGKSFSKSADGGFSKPFEKKGYVSKSSDGKKSSTTESKYKKDSFGAKKSFDKGFKNSAGADSPKPEKKSYFAEKFGKSNPSTGKFNAEEKKPARSYAARELDKKFEGKKKFFDKASSTPKPKRKPYDKDKVKNPFSDAAAGEVYSKKYLEKRDKQNGDAIYTETQPQADEVRLNKYIAHAGVASRRGADELIKEGRVKVNGEVVTEMGYKVKLKDDVEFDGKSLSLERKYYLLLNKPKDFITTVSDERDRKTVMDLIRSAYTQMKTIKRPRLYPVGRLDRNTTGVLLITNDGELAQKLTHPSSEVRKVYHVLLDKKLMKEDFDKIAEGGVVLEDGIAEVDIIAYPNPKNKAEIGLEIHTGKNRFVRRIFESLGYDIEKLDRVSFAGLTKKDLPRGRWRFLQEDEVRLLKHFQK
jgi:23S rRNA pseudouridine2605 synthase